MGWTYALIKWSEVQTRDVLAHHGELFLNPSLASEGHGSTPLHWDRAQEAVLSIPSPYCVKIQKPTTSFSCKWYHSGDPNSREEISKQFLTFESNSSCPRTLNITVGSEDRRFNNILGLKVRYILQRNTQLKSGVKTLSVGDRATVISVGRHTCRYCAVILYRLVTTTDWL